MSTLLGVLNTQKKKSVGGNLLIGCILACQNQHHLTSIARYTHVTSTLSEGRCVKDRPHDRRHAYMQHCVVFSHEIKYVTNIYSYSLTKCLISSTFNHL